jgi:hypothetical protein
LENPATFVTEIKTKLTALSTAKGGSWVSDLKFPWKEMPSQLAKCGLVLCNWPESISLPGMEHKKGGKGIWVLSIEELKILLNTLNDQKKPMYFKKASTTGMFATSYYWSKARSSVVLTWLASAKLI